MSKSVDPDQARSGSKLFAKVVSRGQKSPLEGKELVFVFLFVSSPEHEVLMVSYCDQPISVVRCAASTIALKAYSSYTPGPIDLILGRKHRGDL